MPAMCVRVSQSRTNWALDSDRHPADSGTDRNTAGTRKIKALGESAAETSEQPAGPEVNQLSKVEQVGGA